jgi:large subunit ribosomal protein L23
MDIYQIIVRPLVTEKGTFLAGRRFEGRGGTYSFEVHRAANKTEIKQAVEKIYNVKVLTVRTANRKGKKRRHGLRFGRTPAWQKAYVELHPDHHIDLF